VEKNKYYLNLLLNDFTLAIPELHISSSRTEGIEADLRLFLNSPKRFSLVV
jgi:hypothetical protein